MTLTREKFLEQIKRTVLSIEPDAGIILYGSRARSDAEQDSDWDLLVLLDGKVDFPRTRAIRRRLYELEWENGQVLCSIVRNREDWNGSQYATSDFRENVMREGVWI